MKKLFDKIKIKVLRFILSGVFMRVISFTTTYLFIKKMSLTEKDAYLFALVIDFVIGFFINKYYVYQTELKNHFLFLKFVFVGVVLRAMNYYVYVLALIIVPDINFYGLFILKDYFSAQVISVGLVMIFKFFAYEFVFEKKSSIKSN